MLFWNLSTICYSCYNFRAFLVMSLMIKYFRNFRKSVDLFREKLGLIFFIRPQKYGFDYNIKLKNDSPESKDFWLVVPIPVDTGNQLIGSINFIPGDPKFDHDHLFRNKYAVWNVKLAAGESKHFSFNFKADVSPAVFKNYKSRFAFGDYRIPDEIRNKFCSPNKYIHSDKKIQDLALKIKAGESDVIKVMKKLNDFVIEYLRYANPIDGIYSSKQALENRLVDCGGFDTFFVALANAMGVPARVVCGFWSGYVESSMHAWAEFMLPNGEWVPVDPSVEQLFNEFKTRKSGRFGFAGSDRIIFSYGCDISLVLDGKAVQIDILQNPFLYSNDNLAGIEMEHNYVSEKL